MNGSSLVLTRALTFRLKEGVTRILRVPTNSHNTCGTSGRPPVHNAAFGIPYGNSKCPPIHGAAFEFWCGTSGVCPPMAQPPGSRAATLGSVRPWRSLQDPVHHLWGPPIQGAASRLPCATFRGSSCQRSSLQVCLWSPSASVNPQCSLQVPVSARPRHNLQAVVRNLLNPSVHSQPLGSHAAPLGSPHPRWSLQAPMPQL